MFYSHQPFGQRLKSLRERLSLTQGQLGQSVSVTPAAIYDYEAGRARPSPEVSARLSRALGEDVCAGTDYWLGTPAWRYGLKAVSARFRENPEQLPPPERPASAHYNAARRDHPELVAGLEARIRARPDALEVAAHLARLRFRSGTEGLVALHVAAELSQPVEFRLPSLGFTQHALMDGKTLRPLGHLDWPGFYLRRATREMLIFPDVEVCARLRCYALDFLVRLREGRQRWWIDLEVDGSGHRSRWDRQRTANLDMLTVRLSEAEVASAAFWSILDDKLNWRLMRAAAGA